MPLEGLLKISIRTFVLSDLIFFNTISSKSELFLDGCDTLKVYSLFELSSALIFKNTSDIRPVSIFVSIFVIPSSLNVVPMPINPVPTPITESSFLLIFNSVPILVEIVPIPKRWTVLFIVEVIFIFFIASSISIVYTVPTPSVSFKFIIFPDASSFTTNSCKLLFVNVFLVIFKV